MRLREYDPEVDRTAVFRMWREVGWMEPGQEEGIDIFLAGGRTWVAELNGEAECLVQTAPARVLYLEEELPASIVTAVTTSHVARKQGFPKRLVARLLAQDVADGALFAMLGMFDQGFYNQVGFGTGSYEIVFDFDPATLTVTDRYRTPVRFTKDDWEPLHRAWLARRPWHGRTNPLSPAHTRVEMMYHKKGFGLGYRDTPDGTPSHYVWLDADSMEAGPYRVQWMVFRTREEFRELMALLRGFGDQVRLIHLREPPGVQLQDLLSRPFRQRSITRRGGFENGASAVAYWQLRLLDLAGCLAQTHLPCAPVRFNLVLHDPIEKLLDHDAPWRGLGGEYVVEIGEESRARSGQEPSLPTLTASVNAFSRLWFGVRPASALACTDEFSGPPDLLRQLDEAFRLPTPKPDWDF